MIDNDHPADTSSAAAPTDGTVPLGKAQKSLPGQLAERLLRDIVSGRLLAGDRLKELTLAQEHAVSRATVREALIALSQRGYVEHIPRYGARVSRFAREDALDLFELRAALLGVAAGRCAAAAEPPCDALAAIVAQMEALAKHPDPDLAAFARCSVAAQALLISASGNRYLPAIYEDLADKSTWRLIRGRASGFLTAARRREAASDWRAIEVAIRRRDVAGAELAARRLLAHSGAAVRNLLDARADE